MNTGPAELSTVLTSVLASNSSNYVDSEIVYTIDSNESTLSLPLSKPCETPVNKRFPPWSNEWMVQCLRQADLSMAVGLLQSWMPEK